ncbi:MAG: bifunctional metallophosphatase/5'-nucleotidase [Lachnospiraceae bacterium]|nr:bifunctional metallophosphatase/5'-nucleotidase [Lachnospiraceae bacterium]
MNRKFKIIFTSDTHGHVLPFNYPTNSPENSGLLNIAGQIEKDGDTLVIDGGDSLQGTPLTQYYLSHEEQYDFHPIAEGFNEMKCDYFTLGNHDFNFGYGEIKKYLDKMKAKCLCANVIDKRGELKLEKSTVHTLSNGLRIGITGVVTDYVNLWEREENLTELEVTEPIEAARQELAKLRERSDITVCIYHGGFEKDLSTGKPLADTRENVACEMCEKLDFDILLTGHQHMSIPSVEIAGTHAVQPADQAKEYVELEAVEENGKLNISSEIVKVGNAHEDSLYNRLQPMQAEIQKWLDQTIGELDEEILPEKKLDCAISGSRVADLFNQVELEFSRADFACSSLGNEALGVPKYISIRDVAHIYPFANTLTIKKVTGQTIKDSLERSAEYLEIKNGKPEISDTFLKPKVEHYNYDFWAGLDYEFDLRKPVGERVVKLLTMNGEPVIMNKVYTLAANNYRATGTGGYDAIGKSETKLSSTEEMPDLIIEFLRRHGKIGEIKNRRFKVIYK